jgi:UDP-N-acetyl-D-mannosaminuronate dehydrogenase
MTTHPLADQLQRKIEASNVRVGVIGLGYVGLPFVAAEAWHGPRALQSVELNRRTLEQFDAVVITTDHRAFDYQLIRDHSRCVIDSRDALRRALSIETPDVIRLGAPAIYHPTDIAA